MARGAAACTFHEVGQRRRGQAIDLGQVVPDAQAHGSFGARLADEDVGLRGTEDTALQRQ
jgi:hypothetical protein